MACKVFISHATDKDGAIANRICAALENAGVQCWIAPRDIRPGEDWLKSIQKALRSANVLLLILSESANHSSHVSIEVAEATYRKLKIIPVRIENVTPSGPLEDHLPRIQWLDVFNLAENKESIKKIYETVKKACLPHKVIAGALTLVTLALLLFGWFLIPLPKPHLAVLPFQIQGTLPNHLANASDIFAALSLEQLDPKAYAFLSQNQIQQQLQQQRQKIPNLMQDSAAAAAFGKAVGARYLLTGSLNRLDPNYYLTARLVDTTTGAATFDSVDFDVLRDVSPFIRQLLEKLGAKVRTEPPTTPRFLSGVDLIDAYNAQQGFSISLRTEEGKLDYVEGEKMALKVMVSQDCYVILAEMNSAGDITLLLPNAYQFDNRVLAGQWTRVPSAGARFSFTIQPPFGIDVIKAIATPQPLPIKGVDPEKITAEKFATFNRNARGIGVTAEPEAQPLGVDQLQQRFQPAEWATATLIIKTHAKEQ